MIPSMATCLRAVAALRLGPLLGDCHSRSDGVQGIVRRDFPRFSRWNRADRLCCPCSIELHLHTLSSKWHSSTGMSIRPWFVEHPEKAIPRPFCPPEKPWWADE